MTGILKWRISILLLATAMAGRGQVAADARSRGLACIISFPDDRFTAINNPAWLAGRPLASLGFSSNNKYFLKEMKDLNLAISYGWANDAMGIGICMAGIQPYLEQSYSLSYARKFGERIKSGISLIYMHFNSTEGTRAVYSATFKAGIGMMATEKLTFSFCGINPFGLAISSRDSYYTPRIYITGLVYQPAMNLNLGAEIESSSESGWTIKAALEYSFRKKFAIRTGCLSNPFRFTFGTGLLCRSFCIDLSTEYHSYLGFSPSLSLSYQFGNSANGNQ